EYNISLLFQFPFTHRLGTAEARVYTTVYEGVPFYFVQAWPFFGDDGSVYSEWSWDVPRFIFFNQLVMATAWELNERLGWFPDVFHVNDWHSGLIPFLLHENRGMYGWSKVATLLSIHNLAYQGDHAGGFLFQAGIPERNHPDLVYQDLTDNLMGIALAYSDIITTVSPRYAIEIQYPENGYGLQNLIARRVNDLYGILNGIDTDLWNPSTDPKLISNFDQDNFIEKRPANKAHLQRSLGLPDKPHVPVIGLVSRLVWQKGVDLLVPAMRRILLEQDVQFIALGTGEPYFEAMMRQLMADFGWRGTRILLQYDAAVAQHIYAGSDIFLMPSHFEPCGTGQMVSLRYGSLPLVRETGGLADTVQNYDNADGENGTGFTFLWETADALYQTLRWSLEVYRTRPEAWQTMQRRGMEIDFSWETSAKQYASLYQKAIALRAK
ncbi:MAG TPA: glycogen/starch synthase, partial [Phototrophicaceae bacterium]|nr:glycogen/starch synthase [Phototrophicaceae bacterium]